MPTARIEERRGLERERGEDASQQGERMRCRERGRREDASQHGERMGRELQGRGVRQRQQWSSAFPPSPAVKTAAGAGRAQRGGQAGRQAGAAEEQGRAEELRAHRPRRAALFTPPPRPPPLERPRASSPRTCSLARPHPSTTAALPHSRSPFSLSQEPHSSAFLICAIAPPVTP